MGLTGQEKKDYQRDYMKKKRSNKGLTNDGSNRQGLTQYPTILLAVTDPIKRNKLERISQELNKRRLGKEVRYGVFGPIFDTVAEVLEVT